MADDLEHVEEHVRACIIIFLSLLVLTGFTVLASYLDVPKPAAITIALCIAAVKATLVLLYFMHLVSEKKLIYFSLALTAFFFVGLILLPILGVHDVIRIIMIKGY
jgi:cytochrome c oxidase subunit IV